MTEQERVALHGLKGILQAHLAVNRITIKVANETKACPQSNHMASRADGQIVVAEKAIDQTLTALTELNKILGEGCNV